MLNKCDYNNCDRMTNITITTVNSLGLETKQYCSGIHAALALLEVPNWGLKAKKTTVRVYDTAMSILQKLAKACEKEWQAAAKQ